MDDITPYTDLITKLNKWPIRAPETPKRTLFKLLKEIFSPEEAYLLSKFDTPNRGSLSIDDLMAKDIDPSLTKERVTEILDSIYKRGLLPRFVHRRTNKTHYRLLPLVVGILEYVLCNSKIYSEEKNKKIAKLIDKYYYEGFALELGASNYPWSRVFPHDKAQIKVIKINQTIEGSNEILPFEEVRKIILQEAEICGVMPCACRTHHKHFGDPCEHPIETCMVFENYPIEIGMAREISKDEALQLLLKCEKKGLVHISNNAQKNRLFICNCCPCSCGIMGGLSKLGNPHAFAKSNFIAVIDETKECKECVNCIRLCPMHAIQRWLPHDNTEEKWAIDEEKCIGCGVCASNCPTNRMVLQKIRSDDVEELMTGSWMRSETERFH